MTPKLDGKISMAELRAYYPALAAVAEVGLREPLSSEDAGWLDGPALAKWVYAHGLEPKNRLGGPLARRVRRWKEGDAVNIAQADEVLTKLGHHINDLPDTMWCGKPNRRYGAIVPRPLRQHIVKRHLAGETKKALAEEYGVSVSAIKWWIRQEGSAVTGGLKEAA